MRSPRRVALTAAALVLATVPLVGTGPGQSATPVAENPLAGRPWGVYQGNAELAWAPYTKATGTTKRLLGKIALTPKAKWFGDWIEDGDIAAKVRDYIARSTQGDPETLVSMTVFRVTPWEQDACRRLPTAREKTSYRTWITRFAGAIGDTHVAMVLQPDGPFALCAPRGSRVLSHLVRYAAKKFSALPHTSVYLDAGSADWHRRDPAPAVELLVAGGVAYARGFTLNTTHYDSTEAQIAYGADVVQALAAKGVAGKHFLVDTAENGAPFTGAWWRAHGSKGGRFDNAATCRTATQTHCVTLGIPPTTDVDDPRWGLPADVRELAGEYVDAFVWAGRPWLHNQSSPFDRRRALAVTRTTPW